MALSRDLTRAALAVWLLGGASCSLVLATDGEQCSVDADCAARGSAFAGTVCAGNVCVPPPDPKWSCIGHVAAPVAGSKVAYKAQLLDLITGEPVTKGVTAKLCNKLDPACATPLASAIPDSMGWITASVEPTFEGYFEVTDASMTYLPTLIFMDLVAGPENTDILLIPVSAEMGLSQNAGVPIDPSAGLVLVRTADCTGQRTAGVSVSVSPHGKETGFYLINSAPLPSATETDSSGNAGFVNVATGSIALTGAVAASKEELGKVTTLVRAGTMTYQILRPTPTL
jgi:hypothetical protein